VNTSEKEAAETFLRDHLETYGLCGTNNTVPSDATRPPAVAPTFDMTKDNHVRFGFDDGTFNARPSSSAFYWVAYGKTSRKHEGTRKEIRRALVDMKERFGKISVSNTGNPASRALLAEAATMSIDVEQITVEIDGFPFAEPSASITNRHVKISWADFAKFAEKFGEHGSGDPWVALEAIHGEFTERAHVYTHARLRVVHQNYDEPMKKVIGPPVWSLEEWEATTAVNRWMLATKRTGAPLALLWSPELMAAQLDSPVMRKRMVRAAANPPTLAPPDLQWNTYEVLKAWFPNTPMGRSAGSSRNDPNFIGKMSELNTRLVRVHRPASNLYTVPLARVLEDLGVVYDEPKDSTRELFGAA
jgi:hypothetical protein